jgi:predicted acetyltransferase
VYESEPGRVDGWVSYRVQERWPEGLPANLVKVRMLVGLTPEADAALWRYCLDLDLAGTVRLQDRPVDEPGRWRLADPRRLRTVHVGDHLWVRLLDLPAAMRARRYATDGQLVLEVTDALRPRNQGRFRLEGGPDGAACEPTTAEPDLALDIADLGAAYLGGARLAVLARAGRVVELAPGALLRADAMLASDPAPLCTTHF